MWAAFNIWNGLAAGGRNLVAVTVVAAAGCMHALPLSYSETCGIRGMAMAGAVVSDGGANSTVSDSRGHTSTAYASSHSDTAVCARAVTFQEQCEVRAAAIAGAIKADFAVRSRNFALGVGYVLYVLPGVILYFLFDSQANATMREAELAASDIHRRCMAEIPRPRPAPVAPTVGWAPQSPPRTPDAPTARWAPQSPPPTLVAPTVDLPDPPPPTLDPVPVVLSGCQYDAQCKGARICANERCVDAPTTP
jgi:hypothetical protein